MAFCIALIFKTLTNSDTAKKYSGLSNMDVQAPMEGEYILVELLKIDAQIFISSVFQTLMSDGFLARFEQINCKKIAEQNGFKLGLRVFV